MGAARSSLEKVFPRYSNGSLRLYAYSSYGDDAKQHRDVVPAGGTDEPIMVLKKRPMTTKAERGSHGLAAALPLQQELRDTDFIYNTSWTYFKTMVVLSTYFRL